MREKLQKNKGINLQNKSYLTVAFSPRVQNKLTLKQNTLTHMVRYTNHLICIFMNMNEII